MCVPLTRFTLSISQSNISLKRLHPSFASFRENGIFLQRQHCIGNIRNRRSTFLAARHFAFRGHHVTGSVGYSAVSSSIIRSLLHAAELRTADRFSLCAQFSAIQFLSCAVEKKYLWREIKTAKLRWSFSRPVTMHVKRT